jgi:hypothetical protein
MFCPQLLPGLVAGRRFAGKASGYDFLVGVSTSLFIGLPSDTLADRHPVFSQRNPSRLPCVDQFRSAWPCLCLEMPKV